MTSMPHTAISSAVRAQKTQNNQTESPLFCLPAELRNSIYKYVFSNASSSTDLVPLLACQQVYNEASVLAFSLSNFRLESNRPVHPAKLAALKPEQAGAIDRLTFTTPNGSFNQDLVKDLKKKGVDPVHITVYRLTNEDTIRRPDLIKEDVTAILGTFFRPTAEEEAAAGTSLRMEAPKLSTLALKYSGEELWEYRCRAEVAKELLATDPVLLELLADYHEFITSILETMTFVFDLEDHAEAMGIDWEASMLALRGRKVYVELGEHSEES